RGSRSSSTRRPAGGRPSCQSLLILLAGPRSVYFFRVDDHLADHDRLQGAAVTDLLFRLDERPLVNPMGDVKALRHLPEGGVRPLPDRRPLAEDNVELAARAVRLFAADRADAALLVIGLGVGLRLEPVADAVVVFRVVGPEGVAGLDQVERAAL